MVLSLSSRVWSLLQGADNNVIKIFWRNSAVTGDKDSFKWFSDGFLKQSSTKDSKSDLEYSGVFFTTGPKDPKHCVISVIEIEMLCSCEWWLVMVISFSMLGDTEPRASMESSLRLLNDDVSCGVIDDSSWSRVRPMLMRKVESFGLGLETHKI